MKLAELSDIRKGIKLDAGILVNVKPTKGAYYTYLDAENFADDSTQFVAEEELKRLNLFSNNLFLNYGDYLVYKQEDKFKIKRYEGVSGQSIAGDTLTIISSDNINLRAFLDSEKNKEKLYSEIKPFLALAKGNLVEALSNYEIEKDIFLEFVNKDRFKGLGIISPFNRRDLPIRLTQKNISLDRLIKRIEYGELVLDNTFQKKSSLWTLETKSQFIESLILSMPVPIFYFDVADDDKWLVIDGLQRLNTIVEYLNGRFELTSLDFFNHLNGKRFNDLERVYQKKIEEYSFSVCMLQKGIPQSVKSIIYKNINSSRLIPTF